MKTSTRPPHANRPHKSRGIVGVLAAVGLILIVPLLFVTVIRANVPAKQPPAPPATPVPGFTPGPEHTPAPTAILFRPRGAQPPPCTFPLPQTTTAESQPESYTFSEPQGVLTNAAPYPIDLFQWLPDNQRVLIGLESDQDQSIELFNPQTGQTRVYATRADYQFKPAFWIAGLSAVVYPQTLGLSESRDSNGVLIPHSTVMKSQLLMSRGDPANIQMLEETQPSVDNSGLSVAGKPDGSQIAYLVGAGRKQYSLQRREVAGGSLETVQPPPFDLFHWLYHGPDDLPLDPLSMVWRPGSTQIFLYSSQDWAGNYAFLLDAESGRICEINLFGKEAFDTRRMSWVMTAHWSPNGRYLAVVRTKGWLPIDFSDLIILDSATGKLYQIDAAKLSPPDLEAQGKHFISDVAWAPDNQHLAAIGRGVFYSADNDSPQAIERLYLVNFLVQQAVPISSQELGPNAGGIGETNMLWSGDGSQLLVKCTAPEEHVLCLLSVQTSIQP